MASGDPYVCTLSEELQKKAKTELKETPERRKIALERLRKSVKNYPGLKSPTDDRFLLKFLRARKFDEERALSLIVSFFRARRENTEIFDNFRPSAVKKVLDAGITTVLPGRDDLGRKVLFFRPGLWNPDEFSMGDMFRSNLMTMDVLLDDEETQINGLQLVMDASGFGMRQASYFPSYAKIVFGVIQDAFPARFKGLNYVNEPAIIGWLFPVIKPFLKEKLTSRLHFHGSSYESLHSEIPARILPTELDGKIENFSNEEWKKILLASENKFVDFEKYKLVEDTPGVKGGEIKGDALAGMSGTFRKLNVD